MSVNWLWKNELGYMKYKVTDTKNNKKATVKVDMYAANCLGCYIQNHKKEGTYTFLGFWNDKQHLRNCLGLSGQYKDDMYSKEHNPDQYLVEIGLNTYFHKEAMEIMKEFEKTKRYKIVLYYKEIKKKGGK